MGLTTFAGEKGRKGETGEDDRGQATEDRRQRTEDRRQRTEDRGQTTEDREQGTKKLARKPILPSR